MRGATSCAVIVAAALLVSGCAVGDSESGVSATSQPIAFDPDACPSDDYEAMLDCFLSGADQSLESVWQAQLTDEPFSRPAVEVFESKIDTACGVAKAGYGPVQCPADETIYLPWKSMVTAGERAGAQGPYSAVIVLAHEWAHQVQQAVGIDEAFEADQVEVFGSRNAVSVRTELMADCLAGWWSGRADVLGQFPLLESDVQDAALSMAEYGDDFQAQVSGTGFDPETWDHGSSEQRVYWLAKGFRAGERDRDPMVACDTYTRDYP